MKPMKEHFRGVSAWRANRATARGAAAGAGFDGMYGAGTSAGTRSGVGARSAGKATLTPKLMLQLMAPHTWSASIVPVLVAVALAVASGGLHGGGFAVGGLSAASGASLVCVLNARIVCVLLVISVLMQSAVNTLNDYFDYVKGTDTADNQADPTDAVLVYNNIDPAEARDFAIGLLVAAFSLGGYVIFVAGWIPLAIALVGVAVIYLYSGSKSPISYKPLGELVSGVTMGTLIMLASYQALTLRFDWLVVLFSVPVALGIALIMATNNTCDIAKDIDAHRRTLPVVLGYKRAVGLYHLTVYAWVAIVCVLVLVYFTNGWPVLLFMLLAVHPIGRQLLANPLRPETRGAAFAQCTTLNIELGAFYAAAIIASPLLYLVW